MRITINNLGPDYMIDVLIDGFIRLLGRENINLSHYHHNDPQHGWMHESIKGENTFDFYDSDLLIGTVDIWPKKIEEFKRRTGKPFIIVDGLDDKHCEGPRKELVELCKYYYFREYRKNKEYRFNVKPLSFAAIYEQTPHITPVNRCFFWGRTDYTGDRGEHIREFASVFPMNMDSRISKARYNIELLKAHIGISPRGNGWDCYRHWEIPYFARLLCRQELDIVIENDFDQSNAIIYQTPKQAIQAINDISQNDINDRTAKGHELCLSKHMSIHRAQKILEDLL